MKNKIILILLLSQVLNAVQPVTDMGSYSYYVNQINQTSTLINNSTQQIKSLGGIRSSIDDMKRDIYNAKDTLEGSIKNLKGSIKKLKEAGKSVEVKSLFSMRRDSIGSTSDGVFYDDISNEINSYFKAADEVLIEKNGGKDNMKKNKLVLYKLNKSLGKTSLNGFKAVMGSKINYEELENTRLVEDYIK